MPIDKQTILFTMDIGNIFKIVKDVADVGQDFLDILLTIEQNILLIILGTLAALGLIFSYMRYKGIRSLRYEYRFFFTLVYLLRRIGIKFTKANIYSFKLDDFVYEEPKNDNIIIKECKMDDLSKFGELKDLFLSDMQNGHILVAAFLDDDWVGYKWINLKPGEVEEVERVIHFDGAYLYRAYVKEEYRQMGVMNKITCFTLNQVKNKYGKNKAYEITESANLPANKTLESLKFSRVGTIKYSRIFLWKKYEEKIDKNDTVTLLEV